MNASPSFAAPVTPDSLPAEMALAFGPTGSIGPGAPRGGPDRRKILVHLTPFAPRILPDAGLTHPSRWASYHGVTPIQAVARLAERLERKPARLAFRLAGDAQDVEAFDPSVPADILAILTEGISCAEAEAAREALIRQPGQAGAAA